MTFRDITSALWYQHPGRDIMTTMAPATNVVKAPVEEPPALNTSKRQDHKGHSSMFTTSEEFGGRRHSLSNLRRHYET